MKKISKIKRRKGKIRPPTVGKNCRWLDYSSGAAVCMLKAKTNNGRSDAKCADYRVYNDISCNKCRGCGYEEDVSGETMVSRLNRKLTLKRELNKVRSRLNALEKIIDED